MKTDTMDRPGRTRCVVCEGGAQRLSSAKVQQELLSLAGWRLIDDDRRIRKDWQVRSFRAGMEFLNRVAEVAEQGGHHPDLHLEEYRHVSIVLWTHAFGGLSASDFLLAAEIDRLPVRLKKVAVSR